MVTRARVFPDPRQQRKKETIMPTLEEMQRQAAKGATKPSPVPPPTYTNGEPGPIPHVEPVIRVSDHMENMENALRAILHMDVYTEPGQEEPHSVMRRVAAQGLSAEEPKPVMSPHVEPFAPIHVHEHHHASFDVPGYEHLADILTAAYNQSARGKGKERHANAAPWHEQRINTIPAQQKSIADGLAYQVQKKTLEACDMAERGDLDAAEREMLGAIVYAAACIEQIRRAKLIKA